MEIHLKSSISVLHRIIFIIWTLIQFLSVERSKAKSAYHLVRMSDFRKHDVLKSTFEKKTFWKSFFLKVFFRWFGGLQFPFPAARAPLSMPASFLLLSDCFGVPFFNLHFILFCISNFHYSPLPSAVTIMLKFQRYKKVWYWWKPHFLYFRNRPISGFVSIQ